MADTSKNDAQNAIDVVGGVAAKVFEKLSKAMPVQKEPSHYIDAHTHVHFAAFKDDCRATVERALAKDVHMVTVGTQRDTSADAVRLAHEFPKGVWAAIGLHPIHTEASFHDTRELGGGESAKEFTGRGEVFDYDVYKNLAEDPRVVAIGECGMDYYHLTENSKKLQTEVFRAQIALAHEVRKPLMIHCRNAFTDLIYVLNRESDKLNDPPGIVHFFTGTPEEAMMLMDLGFAFTFGGVITFTDDYDKAIRSIPMDHLLSETDAPYVAPVPYRGKRNEPAYVTEVVARLAAIKAITPEEMQHHIWKNAKRIFNFL
ncbi:MAG: TatD-related deoxyribonuclease YabD, TatD DNase family protein [Candidatus Parcubacteria bacterium]|jgi:TatD DNase family protein